jgi:hypothetical protein
VQQIGRTPKLLRLARWFAVAIPLLVATPAAATVPATCFPTLPAVPGDPLFTITGGVFAERIRLDLWRQPCVDGSGETAVLIQATPVTPAPLLCSFSFRMIQLGVEIQGRIRTSTDTAVAFCDDLPFAATFVLDEQPGDPPLIEELPFTLLWATPLVNVLEVPQRRPPAPPAPRVSIVTTGCLTCRPGDFAQVHLHLTNPGPPRNVEVKAGSHFPNGVTVLSLVGPHLEMTVPSGESDIAIPGLFVPADVERGAYLIEARLLDPVLGTTLSADYLSLRVIP